MIKIQIQNIDLYNTNINWCIKMINITDEFDLAYKTSLQ